MKFKIACGTNDEKEFTLDHFGDSEYFLIYKIDTEKTEINFLEKIKNISEKEDFHGDIKKAKGISSVLKEVQVLVAFVMGPNIVRMRKKFILVISRNMNINKSIDNLKKIIPDILIELKNKSEDKKIFYLK
jgi:predicted Fe-Mo cluster-binding NifX family protein